MPFQLEKEKTGVTPYVLIDEAQGHMRFEGESYSENIIVFFQPISDWLSEYLQSDFEKFTFDCELTYFNSSTAKILSNIISDIDEFSAGKDVVINWITTADDDINLECGEDFKEDIQNAVFNIVITDA